MNNSLNLRQNVKPNLNLNENMFKSIKNNSNSFKNIIQIKKNFKLNSNPTFNEKLRNYNKKDIFKANFNKNNESFINKKPVFYNMNKRTHLIQLKRRIK